MPIILAAILETLLYLSAVPLCAAFTLSTEHGLRFGVGLSLFDRRAALRRARKCRPVKTRRRGAGSAWRIALRLRGAHIRLQGRLGLGDAAATALACGALRALAASLGSAAGRVTVDVAPLFDAPGPCLALTGMIRLRTGQIMTAMAKRQIDRIHRRIARWTDTRLKA